MYAKGKPILPGIPMDTVLPAIPSPRSAGSTTGSTARFALVTGSAARLALVTGPTARFALVTESAAWAAQASVAHFMLLAVPEDHSSGTVIHWAFNVSSALHRIRPVLESWRFT